ncbi:cadherin repeat domain-containing protein [Lacinutrix sp. C3R15]|uniref:cadherin repeat domain-containing protein n=1 Tax=Flavobacteriaceae TaxID=49546 RepID=UPI001C08F61B|nr:MULTISPECIES: cadherin repeat domain-containing protein [Flavobacteriaceae]MBU2937918.1 cadherin repeat domain-containing protein [Lacinutrix sp. C3R15]MDO6621232.1 cadherin repeat domain-containing protein [Oceanihabitans sp. 1_MG-2023]
MKTTLKISCCFILIFLLTFSCSSDDDGDTSPPANVSASDFTNSIAENSENGTIIGNVQATAGQGDLNYVISTQTPNGALSINPSTGELSVANSTLFDFETNPSITASVTVSDDLSSATSSVTVNVSDVKDVIYKHTASVGNTEGEDTFIDHPYLNANPNAKIAISHNWNDGTYNNKTTGVWYNPVEMKWAIFNEDTTPMLEGSTFNVYIAMDGELITHIATEANQGTNSSYTIIDHPLANGNPNQKLIVTTTWDPNSVYNPKNYGVWYDGTNWNIYTEGASDIPNNAAFNVLIKGDAAEEFSHQATAANISGNYTIIDHASLNNNPDAKFVFTHNWGAEGDSRNVVLDKTLSLWYTGTNWSIYTEDLSVIPEDISFDIVVTDN